MRLDIAHEHRKPDAARANHEGRFDIIVLMDVGWHVDSPPEILTKESIRHWSPDRRETYASGARAILNSREHRQNVPTIPMRVACLHMRDRTATNPQFFPRDSGLPAENFDQFMKPG